MLKFRQYIRELTISPDYQSRVEVNPFYDLDINLNDITDVVGDGKIKFRSVDVGAGTGIWTRMVLNEGVKSVIAVEPNSDMLKAGQNDSKNTKINWKL